MSQICVFISVPNGKPHYFYQILIFLVSEVLESHLGIIKTPFLQPSYFDQLFTLMKNLSDERSPGDNGVLLPHPKGQILSRRVWDILMLLPTNQQLKESLQNIGASTDEATMKSLLNPESPQKLLYTLYIVDWLGRPARFRRHSGPADSGAQDHVWIHRFIECGGLKHLFNIFLKGSLQTRDGTVWCEWKQDCLSFLLKLLVQVRHLMSNF